MQNHLNTDKNIFAVSSNEEKAHKLFKVIKFEKSKTKLLDNSCQVNSYPLIEIKQLNDLDLSKEKKEKKEEELKEEKEGKEIKERKEVKIIPWTEEDDKLLLIQAKENNEKNWKKIASSFKGRTPIQCSSRYHRIKPGLMKGSFSREEDIKLISLYKIYGKKWNLIAKGMKNRTGKQVRDRFLNSLAPGVNKKRFTLEEDKKIIKYYKIYGKSWSSIAKHLTGRTGDMIKNRFYSNLSKKYNQDEIEFDKNEEEKDIPNKENIENIESIEKLLNSKNISNEILEKAKNSISNNSVQINYQNNFIFNQQNTFLNNSNFNFNNFSYMKNHFGETPSFFSDLLVSNLLKKENRNNINNNYDVNNNSTNIKNSLLINSNEINRNYSYVYNNNNEFINNNLKFNNNLNIINSIISNNTTPNLNYYDNIDMKSNITNEINGINFPLYSSSL